MTDAPLSVLERTATAPVVAPTDDGDHDRYAHYVHKDALARATFEGIPATAICGKQMLSQRDPSRYPVCPTCKEVYEQMQPGDEDSPDYKAP